MTGDSERFAECRHPSKATVRLILSWVVFIVAALGALSVGPSTASATPLAAATTGYTYDGFHRSAALNTTATERGPPSVTFQSIADSTVDLGSEGVSACAEVAKAGAITYKYDRTVVLAQGADSSDAAQGVDGDLSRVLPSFVAAKTGPTVTFSRSRAPGIAENFDNAVANGAPTNLTRVGDATRKANRRDALRGQPRGPAGQSLDEYPFACSAQGGCGSFVRSVPVGEQSYQGGVLSQFFQRSGVRPGDPFNVMFGP